MCKASTAAETFPRGGSKDLFPSLNFKSFTSWHCLVCQIFLGIFQIMVHSRCSIVPQPNSWLWMLPLLESRVSWCPGHVLHPCFKHLTFSRGAVYLCTAQVCLHTHRHIHGRQGSQMDGTGAALKSTKAPKNQHSTHVQLTPHTFKKPSPQPLPACSTQTSSQCLLLYLSLKLQYYWEASGSLILPSASQVHSGKVFTAQAPPFGTVKMSKPSPTVITSPTLSWSPFIYPQMTIVYTYCQQSLPYKIFITLNAGRLVNVFWWQENQEMKS